MCDHPRRSKPGRLPFLFGGEFLRFSLLSPLNPSDEEVSTMQEWLFGHVLVVEDSLPSGPIRMERIHRTFIPMIGFFSVSSSNGRGAGKELKHLRFWLLLLFYIIIVFSHLVHLSLPRQYGTSESSHQWRECLCAFFLINLANSPFRSQISLHSSDLCRLWHSCTSLGSSPTHSTFCAFFF